MTGLVKLILELENGTGANTKPLSSEEVLVVIHWYFSVLWTRMRHAQYTNAVYKIAYFIKFLPRINQLSPYGYKDENWDAITTYEVFSVSSIPR